ncbi:hypothetical protein LEP1GSC172_3350 [Leptospira noguchii]|uniref:Uncharacterized protein n=1 Tax=Leptospira noguchii TaxID=28182 RepID=M6V5D6_9LEPT|nr:hypothetical protein LEP1GSC172_3350 [Leptospira noguchii]
MFQSASSLIRERNTQIQHSLQTKLKVSIRFLFNKRKKYSDSTFPTDKTKSFNPLPL